MGWDALIGFDARRHDQDDAPIAVRYQRPGTPEGQIQAADHVALPRFVTGKGGGYFFAPSIPALAALASGRLNA